MAQPRVEDKRPGYNKLKNVHLAQTSNDVQLSRNTGGKSTQVDIFNPAAYTVSG